MMVGSVLNREFAPYAIGARHSRPPQDVPAQRRALLLELAGSVVAVGLSVALASVALGASPILYALAAGAAAVIGLSRYVELMFRIAYLNALPARDHGLLRLAALGRWIGGTGAAAALTVALILVVAS